MSIDGVRPRSGLLLGLAFFAAIFGAATVISGGRVLFGPLPVRAAAGHVVGFVLWFNFLAGFVYLLAAAGLALGRRWGAWLSAAIVAGTALVFVAFGAHVLGGGAFERRTLLAMTFRTGAWVAITLLAWRRLRGDRGALPSAG
jgi:voltage-gated potassium channel Kch